VLRRVGPETSEAEVELQRRAAERILAALIAGRSWDDAVGESEDADTRNSSGLLGLFGAGELPPVLDRVAFRLEPGQVSSVIRSSEGFHILYRPGYEDVASLFAIRQRERRLAEAEASSREGLLERRGVVYSPDVTASLRRLAGDPWVATASGTEMASWEGGALPEGSVARYLVALPPGSLAEMVQAAEPVLLAFIEDLALRELRAGDAEVRGLMLEEAVRSQLEEQHAQEVDYWMRSLGVERASGVAREDLDRYMEEMVSRRVEARSLAPLFEAWLLDGTDWSLEPTGISGAIAGARSMLEGVATSTESGVR
jgi:peptidyl-prolyl cis-trans isomerase SurA